MDAATLRLAIPSLKVLQQRVSAHVTCYTRPIELSSFSYDGNRKLHLDRSELKRYQPASNFFEYANLRDGFENFVCKPDDLQEHLDALILSAEAVKVDFTTVDIVTWRGIITKILCTPFLDDCWTLHGNLRNGTIFLEERKELQRYNRRHREFIYGGFKFEELCMVPLPASLPLPLSFSLPLPMTNDKEKVPMAERAQRIVNNNSEFGIVFKSTLGSHRLLVGAEVDGLDEDGKNYIELKTTGILKGKSSRVNFEEKKLLKWWTQSFLVGIPKILVGYRNDNGWVESLESISVESIPRRLRGRVQWDPQVLLSFGDLLFTWLKQMVLTKSTSDTTVSFTLSFEPFPIASSTDNEKFITLNFSGPIFIPP